MVAASALSARVGSGDSLKSTYPPASHNIRLERMELVQEVGRQAMFSEARESGSSGMKKGRVREPEKRGGVRRSRPDKKRGVIARKYGTKQEIVPMVEGGIKGKLSLRAEEKTEFWVVSDPIGVDRRLIEP